MAFPRFMYGDPSKCVDHIRRKRAQHEERQQDRGKEGLEKLFKSNDEKDKDNG